MGPKKTNSGTRRAANAAAGQQKMFSQIEAPERQALNAFIAADDGNGRIVPGLKTPGNSNLMEDNKRINADDIMDPLKEGYIHGLIAPTTSKYLQMICHYVNERAVPPRHLPGTIPICARTDWRWFTSRRRPNDGQLNFPWLTDELDKANLDRDTFQNQETPIQYIFIPVNVQYKGQNNTSHSTLLVVSPRNKTVEYLDSDGGLGNNQIEDIITILCEHLGPDFHPYQWKIRTGQSFTQGQRAVDCALHTTSNAMELAFGYPFHRGEHSIINRRNRLATEFLHGRFEPEDRTEGARNPYYYPLNPLLKDNDPKDGWQAIPLKLVAQLPFKNRARRGLYEDLTSKVELRKVCSGRVNKGEMYPGITRASGKGVNFAQFKEWVEDRDEVWRTRPDRPVTKKAPEVEGPLPAVSVAVAPAPAPALANIIELISVEFELV